MKRLVGGVFLSALLALTSLAASGTPSSPKEYWFDFKFNGKKVGFMQSLDEDTTVNDRPALHMRRWSVVSVRREKDTMKMESTTDSWTDLEGHPMRFTHTRYEGSDPRSFEGYRDGDQFIVKKNIGGNLVETKVPLGKDVYASAALDALFNEKLKVGKVMTGKAIVEDEGELRDFVCKVTGTEKTPEGEAFVVDLTIGGVASRELVLKDGRTLKAQIPALGAEFTLTTRDKAVQFDESFDIFTSALFKMPVPLPPGETIDELVVRLQGKSGRRPTYISDQRQKAKLIGKGEVELRIRTDAAPIKPPRLPIHTPAVKRFLSETPHEPLRDERLVATEQKIVADERNAWEAAKKINAFVYRYITNKSLSRAFATATEALEKKEGDCTEHAVLFSALAKIAGIPTRLVTGLVYVGGTSNVFGYHEWVEVWMGDRWIAMDPTFGQDIADPTHIKFTQGLSDPDGLRDAGVIAAGLIADLDLKVQRYTTLNGVQKTL
jgi:transglutaminase superfamily protein